MTKEQLENEVHQLVLDLLDGTLVCTRVWEAWGVGTMKQDDFSDAVDDPDFFFERRQMVLDFLEQKILNNEPV
jgi:hypothetical protein